MAYVDPTEVCAPWIDPDDLCCEGAGTVDNCDGSSDPLVYKFTDADYVLAASNFLFARTCYRYPGLCAIEVWPCHECTCGCHPCACGTWSALTLPTDYPVDSITSVTIDGVPMAPGDYRLDLSRYLVRMDGERWPSCNSFGLPNTSSSEIRVQAVVGRTPPVALRMAAAEFACQMKKACNNDATCALPPNVRSITRRGVEMEIDDITTLFEEGLTGIPSVDAAIKTYGNCGHHGSAFDPTRPLRGYGAI